MILHTSRLAMHILRRTLESSSCHSNLGIIWRSTWTVCQKGGVSVNFIRLCLLRDHWGNLNHQFGEREMFNFLKPAALWGREGPDMREAAKTHDKDLY